MKKIEGTILINNLENYKNQVEGEAVIHLIEETQQTIRDLMEEIQEKDKLIDDLIGDSCQGIDGGNLSI